MWIRSGFCDFYPESYQKDVRSGGYILHTGPLTIPLMKYNGKKRWGHQWRRWTKWKIKTHRRSVNGHRPDCIIHHKEIRGLAQVQRRARGWVINLCERVFTTEGRMACVCVHVCECESLFPQRLCLNPACVHVSLRQWDLGQKSNWFRESSNQFMDSWGQGD